MAEKIPDRSAQQMIVEKLVQIEKCLLGGSTWATETMTFGQRLKFFRDTREWPGLHLKEATEMFVQGDIDAERRDGKVYCAKKKLSRAKEAGLTIK